jgi:non-specific serine/threonine protein kinase
MVLRALREARGVTLDGWGAHIGVSRTTVQRWERGERSPDPGAETAIVNFCREAGLFRAYDRGPLAGINLTAEMLQDLFAEARWRTCDPPVDEAPSADRPHPSPTNGILPTSAQTPPTSLPVQLTSFVGREQEMAAVRRVQAGTRLLTLTGAGGCGKTRLALALAGELLWAYPHGVWFVDLASLADPALIPQAIASTLAIHTTGPQPVAEVLIESIQPRHLLLLLDNCEHLLPACAELTEILLRACPHLAVIATSRSSLGIPGETVWRVPPMAVPSSEFGVVRTMGANSEPRTPNSEPVTADAVRLFLERARLQRPEITITVADAAAVAEICRQLDGMPLAIELAAARVNLLSVRQIAERLHDRFRLLTTGGRTTLPRHQTLRATLDWSHDLLTPTEQALFRTLSVFAGRFTLEAVEAVCADLPPPTPLPSQGRGEPDSTEGASISSGGSMPIRIQQSFERTPPSLRGKGAGGLGKDPLDLLARLVDLSLVNADDHGDVVRYRLLETVRQYAAEMLDTAGETESARDRHLAWYLELAQAAGKAFQGPDEPAWLNQLEEEHDNLRAALTWSLARAPGRSPDRRGLGNRMSSPISDSNAEAALRLAGALPRFWEMRGHMSEGRQWLAQALEADDGAAPTTRAHALNGAGMLAQMQGDYTAARALAQESLFLNHKVRNRQGIAEARWSLGYVTLRCGDHDAARVSLEESLTLHTELRCARGIAGAHGALGVLALRQGNHDAARGHFEESLARHREIGDQDGIAAALADLASVTGDESFGVSPALLLEESLSLYREIGNRQGIALVLSSLGTAALFRGDHEHGAPLLAEGLTLYREVGDRRGIARLLGLQAFMALSQRDYPRATTLCRESLSLYQVVQDPVSIALYLPVLAGAALGQGQADRAARLFGAATAMRQRLGASLPPSVQLTHDRAVATVRAALGEDAFASAWVSGETMSSADAITYALSGNPGALPQSRMPCCAPHSCVVTPPPTAGDGR